MLPRQCLLHGGNAVVYTSDSKLWLDGLYFRMVEEHREEEAHEEYLRSIARVIHSARSDVWMTGVTLQANGDIMRDITGQTIAVGGLYAEGAVTIGR